jgi:RNA polymerase sigma-70 factor, ECF subfamily
MERRAVMERQRIDDDVISGCQRGDPDAFRDLFQAYKDKVFSLAVYSFGGDESTAHDITQQVFLRLLTRIGQFRRDAEFTTWLYRLVLNVCIDEHRRRRRFLPIGEGEALPAMPFRDDRSEERDYARTELADSVRAAITQLKPKLRLPILLKYIEGLSYEEIAAVLGCSKGTVASRLNRGHRALAKQLAHLRGEVVLGE